MVRKVLLAPPLRSEDRSSYWQARNVQEVTQRSEPKKEKSRKDPSQGLGLSLDTPPRGAFPGKAEQEISVASVLALARQLGASDLRALLAELALLAQTPDAGSARDVEMWSRATYEAAVAAFGAGGRSLPGPALFRRSVGSGASWSAVRAFMLDAGLADKPVAEREKVCHMLARLVTDQALYLSRERGVPFGPKLLANVATNIASLFDQAYPGYLQGGLVLFVANATPRKEHHHDD